MTGKFGEYFFQADKSAFIGKERRGWIKFSITQKDRRKISVKEVTDFLTSYFDDIGKWENMLYVGEEIINVGIELLKGFELPIKYTPQGYSKFKNKYSFTVEDILGSSDVKTVTINVKDIDELNKDEFIHIMENIEKWRSFKNCLNILKNLKTTI